MATTIELSVIIKSRNNRELPSTEGKVLKAVWSQKDRTTNGLRLFGILLAASFCSIFAHPGSLILVPSFFISAFIFGYEKYQELEYNQGGEGECPKCHHTLKIVKSKMKSRLTDTCGKCFEELEILIKNSQDVQS